MFFYLLLIMTAGYIAIILWITLGLFRIPKTESHDQPFISVIVAARDEQDNIVALLQSLTEQNYPKEKYEIIIVNDGSTDHTAEYIQSFQSEYPDSKITQLFTENRESIISPKKNAITMGIEHAKGDLILLTDADCFPPVGWIQGLVKRFTPETGMVIGFSPYELPSIDTIPAKFLALDALSLAAIAAGTSGWGFPATCNGRNLAYRKSVFKEVGGFEKIKQFASGDDDLFLKLVLNNTDWKIRYAYDADLEVPTVMLSNISQFFHQRMRHASKGLHYEPVKIMILVLVYLFNLFLLITLLGLLFGIINSTLFLLFAKFMADFLLLAVFAGKMKKWHYLTIFPLASIAHLFYVVIFGALGQLKWFKWK